MKKTYLPKQLLPWVLAVAVLGILSTAVEAEYRTFKSADGKTMNAELVAVNGSMVTAKLESTGREIRFPMDVLSDKDQSYIAKWAEENETFRIKIDARKKMTGSDNSKKGNTKTNVRNYVYNVSVENWGRNPVGHTTVKYRIYKECGSFMEGSTEFEQIEPKMTQAFETNGISLSRSETVSVSGGG